MADAPSPVSPTDVPDEWDAYSALVDDAPALVAFNGFFEAIAPLASHPTLISIRMNIENPGEHGVGEPDESETLTELEDRVAERLAKSINAYFVGHLRTQGRWEMFLYAPGEDNLENALREAFGDDAAREPEIMIAEDPEWSVISDFLLPDSETRRRMHDQHVVMALEAEGDDLSKSRPIDHFIYFADTKQRDLFATAVKEAGFAVPEEGEIEPDEPGDAWGLIVRREDAATLEHISTVTAELAALAATHEGDYDGWESPVTE